MALRRLAIFVTAAVLAGGGAAVGYAAREPVAEPLPKPVPGPTETVVKTKKVRVEDPLDLSLVPLRTPLSLPARGSAMPARRLLVPPGAHLEDLKRVPAAGGIPPQIVVVWRKGEPDLPDALGLLLWELDESGRKPRWRVGFGIHEADLGCHSIASTSVGPPSSRRLEFNCAERAGVLVGPPFEETKEKLVCGLVGPFLGFSLADLTGDGHPDVFVTEGSCGSGGVAVRRVLVTSEEGTRQVFRRVAGDTQMEIVDGAIRVSAAVHRKNDSHCCPSFLRRYTLVWNGTEFVRTNDRLVEA